VKEELIKRFGAHRVLDVPTNEGEIPLIMLDLEIRGPISILMTNGLSDYKMPVPEKLEGREYNELFFCLPSYWEWEDMENPRTNWVFKWIQRLAKHVVEKETWFGHGHTMPCGATMESLSETMLQNHFILTDPMLLENELAPIKVGDKEVHFLAIIPMFPDEMDYKQGKGTFKLLQKFRNKAVTEQLDDFRSTVLKRNWRLRR
jgi:hypothetical protein